MKTLLPMTKKFRGTCIKRYIQIRNMILINVNSIQLLGYIGGILHAKVLHTHTAYEHLIILDHNLNYKASNERLVIFKILKWLCLFNAGPEPIVPSPMNNKI